MRRVVIPLFTLALVACAADPRTQVVTDAGRGAVVGGLLGGLLGDDEGALLGSALGGLAGGAASIYLRSHSADQGQLLSLGPEYRDAQARAREAGKPEIVFLSAEAVPEIVFPGGNVELVISYRVIGPEESSKLSIREERLLTDGAGTKLWLGRNDSRLRGGAYRSTQLFQVPDEASEGDYSFRARLVASETMRESPGVGFHVATTPEEG